MNALKSRRTAVAVFVIVVVVFSLIGCHRSLSRRVAVVENSFFAETLTSPATQLNEGAKYANRILTVINGELDEALYTDVLDSRSALLNALEARDIAAASAAADTLSAAIDAVERDAAGHEFQSVEDIGELIENFRGAMRVARNASYNEEMDRFMETVAGRFPANILRHIAFVDMPERFE